MKRKKSPLVWCQQLRLAEGGLKVTDNAARAHGHLLGVHFTQQFRRTVKLVTKEITGFTAIKKKYKHFSLLCHSISSYSTSFTTAESKTSQKRTETYSAVLLAVSKRGQDTVPQDMHFTLSSPQPSLTPTLPHALSPSSHSRLLFLAFCFFSAVIVHGRGGGEEKSWFG